VKPYQKALLKETSIPNSLKRSLPRNTRVKDKSKPKISKRAAVLDILKDFDGVALNYRQIIVATYNKHNIVVNRYDVVNAKNAYRK
jgi:hypothetical protein